MYYGWEKKELKFCEHAWESCSSRTDDAMC